MLKTVIERCISENSMKSFSSKKGRNLVKNRGTNLKMNMDIIQKKKAIPQKNGIQACMHGLPQGIS